MGISVSPFIELETVQVQLKNFDNIFFQQDEGLSVVYGVNGVGKSTIIEGMRLLLGESAASDNSQRVRGYLKFHGSLEFLEYAAAEIEDFFESEYFEDFARFAKRPARPWYAPEEKQGIPIWEHSVSKAQDSLVAFERWMNEKWTLKNDIDHVFLEKSDFEEIPEELIFKVVIGKIMMKSVGLQGHAQCNPFEFVKSFVESIREGLVALINEYDLSELNFETVTRLCQKYSVSLDIDEEFFTSFDFDTIPAGDLADFFVFLKMKRFDDVLERLIQDEEYFDLFFENEPELLSARSKNFKVGDLVPDAIDLGTTLFAAMQRGLLDGTFWFEPRIVAESGKKRWIFGLALETSIEGEAIIRLRELIDAKRPSEDSENSIYWGAFLLVFFASECFPHVFETSPQHTRASIASDFDSYDSNNPYFCVPGPICELREFPLTLVDLNSRLDLDEVARKSLEDLVNDEVDATFIVDEKMAEGAIKMPKLSVVEVFTQELSSFLRKLEIGISGCFFSYSDNLVDWTRGNTAHFVFETTTSSDNLYQKRIRFEALSSAQKFWVSAAFRMKLASFELNECLIIADEPESGLHERAVVRVLEELSEAVPSAVIASHSSRSLSLRSARLLHLERTEAGKTVLNPPHLGEDVAAAALRLGTSTFDLFGLKRALVLVEGSHDVEVVRGLTSLDPSRNLLDKLIIVPCRGVRNVATIADSAIVTDFTSLHILVVVDNGRIARLREIVDSARLALESGQSAAQAITACGLRLASVDSSFEERVLLDLIERAIHRQVLNRLHLFALPCEDIIELLPSEAFGLDCSWQELRQEFRSSSIRINFKEWIRTTRGVAISTKSVRRAFDRLDALTEDLEALRRELEVVASLSPLD